MRPVQGGHLMSGVSFYLIVTFGWLVCFLVVLPWN